jgi:hypothetical protein
VTAPQSIDVGVCFRQRRKSAWSEAEVLTALSRSSDTEPIRTRPRGGFFVAWWRQPSASPAQMKRASFCHLQQHEVSNSFAKASNATIQLCWVSQCPAMFGFPFRINLAIGSSRFQFLWCCVERRQRAAIRNVGKKKGEPNSLSQSHFQESLLKNRRSDQRKLLGRRFRKMVGRKHPHPGNRQ